MTSTPGKAVKRALNRLRQRRHPRYRCEFPVKVSMFCVDGHRQLNAHCKDLSEAGMGVLVAEELTAGEVVALSFVLPGAPQPWDVRAVLRHRRGFHYGFEFLSLSREQDGMLKRYLPTLQRADSEE